MNNGDMPASAPNAGWRDNDPKAVGLTKREVFAMAAMQGLLASIGGHDVTESSEIAHDAAVFADALLAELEATNERV